MCFCSHTSNIRYRLPRSSHKTQKRIHNCNSKKSQKWTQTRSSKKRIQRDLWEYGMLGLLGFCLVYGGSDLDSVPIPAHTTMRFSAQRA